MNTKKKQMGAVWLLLLACALLGACTQRGRAGTTDPIQNSIHAALDGAAPHLLPIPAEGISDDYLREVANTAGMALARQYPPGRTTFSVRNVIKDSPFNQLFEDDLRAQGFKFEPVALTHETLELSYRFDAIDLDGKAPCPYYLYVRVSDGFSFGQMYLLDEAGLKTAGVETRTEPFVTMDTETEGIPEPAEEWRIAPGSLRDQVEAWAARAEYQLVWKAEHDFTMQSHIVFRDAFAGAVRRLFTRMHQNGNALRVRLYRANKVVEVGEN